MRWVVAKLGTAAVSSAPGWAAVARALRDAPAGQHTVLVCDRLAGPSLRELAQRVADGADPEGERAALVAQVTALAEALGVGVGAVAADLDEAGRLLAGVGLLGEAGPRALDRVEALGPQLTARLGAAWLAAQGLDARWADACDVLVRDDRADAAMVRERLRGATITVVGGGTVRSGGQAVGLGAGGVDVSAAILAVRLGAARLEVWSDRPGLFTADPQRVPGARLLRTLDFLEAQQLATQNPDPVHPRALGPLREARIPLHLRWLGGDGDGSEGTVVAPEVQGAAQVKAIAGRKGLVLVSMDTVGMWQQVGFLARAFGAFAALGLSVDSVSTSETEVTATLDPSVPVSPEALERLVSELAPLCRARVQPGCASVSLVGRGIRGILHQLAPVLEVFEEQPVHIVSQAASDLNLTFVVDEAGADRLVARLHALLFAHRGADALLGPTWQELTTPGPRPVQSPVVEPWWAESRDGLLAVAAEGTPVYVAHAPTIDARAAGLLGLEHVERVLYAVKANPNAAIVARLGAAGLGFETVSPGEIARVRSAAGPDPFVLFTPNFAPRAELEAALDAPNVQVTLDDPYPLERWPERFAGRDLFVRIDPGRGRGHHAHVRTAGARSKFGVAADQLDRLAGLARDVGARIVGLHAHVGSGVLDPGSWRDVALSLVPVAERFPDVRVLDLGGGLGVPDRPGRPSLDLGALDHGLSLVRRAHPERALWLEPGRYLVAEAGVLLATVTQLKRKGDLLYVGVDAGMHTLIRPALYGAHHPVVNLTRLPEAKAPMVTATVVGPICETGDVLARDRVLAEPREGDVLLIGVAGAYGAAMASEYNLRGRPREVMLA